MTVQPFLHLLTAGASSLIVGVLDPDGEPFATRAWGVEVLSHEPLVLRVLLSAGSMARIGRVTGDSSPFPFAMTAADVPSLSSVQIKGSACDLEAVTPADLERSAAYQTEFFSVIHRTDGYDADRLARWAPHDLVACTVEVRELFDQTPGPNAGARLEAGTP